MSAKHGRHYPEATVTPGPSERFTDAEVAEWMERHDLEMAFGGDPLGAARCAMEDAASLHALRKLDGAK